MKRKDWSVGDNGVRPAGPKDRCFYCGAKVGSQHKEDCVIRSKTVKMRMTLDYVIDVPEFWDKEDIEFHFNESSWCADNILEMLEDREERENCSCLCNFTKFDYLGEATEEDENKWGMVRVKELKG